MRRDPAYIVNPETGCWEWQWGKSNGYGCIQWHRRAERAHRIYYECIRGIVPPGLELDHLCRNKACVNPDHLEPVTSAENIRRARSKIAPKIGPEDADEIRRRYAAGGITHRALAAEYSVSRSHIHRILKQSSRSTDA